MKKCLVLLLALALCFSGCSAQTESSSSQAEVTSTAPAETTVPETTTPEVTMLEPDSSAPEETNSLGIHPYLQQLVEDTVEQLVTPEMSEYERTKAAFDYMIEHTYLDEPIGLNLWQIYGGGEPIPFVEQRAISPLRFGVGMCEDYAAALTLLLRGMGLEAEYVPGLTYSEEGHLVDHAWTVVRIDGVWYHLDSQLEDNISRHGYVRYRYFLKGDATLASSHRWGQNLMDSGLLSQEQNAEIAENYLTPSCPQDYPTPERHTLEDQPEPDLEALRAQAEEEVAAYEEEYGPLEPMQLNTTPPVFGLDGYGPADEG